MATGIPVQFISLTQVEYDNLETKQDGKLYFTNDTHRIYKGQELYGGNQESFGSQGYAFHEVEPETIGGYKVFNLNDHTINTFTLSDSTPVKVVLPNATDSNSRDLIIKVNVTSETIPHFEIIPPSDVTSMGIESVDDSWAELEPGINYFTITETVREQ